MARKKRGRSISGILVLDKPAGISSNAALQKVKRIFGAAKAGHTGCLDPLATGVLPICLGEATKFSQYLLDSDKAYNVTARLGEQTDTADSEGNIVASYEIPQDLDYPQLDQVCQQFAGDIEQRPPMYSAIKKDGQPLYKLARQGIEVDIPTRQVSIYSIKLQAFNTPYFEASVQCSKGTYIRSLVEDIGKQCAGSAHVTALRRTVSGPFKLAEAYTIEALEQAVEQGGWSKIDEYLLPVNGALTDMPKIELDSEAVLGIKHGQSITLSASQLQACSEGKVQLIACLPNQKAQFWGVGHVTADGNLTPKRLVVEPVVAG